MATEHRLTEIDALRLEWLRKRYQCIEKFSEGNDGIFTKGQGFIIPELWITNGYVSNTVKDDLNGFGIVVYTHGPIPGWMKYCVRIRNVVDALMLGLPHD